MFVSQVDRSSGGVARCGASHDDEWCSGSGVKAVCRLKACVGVVAFAAPTRTPRNTQGQFNFAFLCSLVRW